MARINTRPYLLDISTVDTTDSSGLKRKLMAEAIEIVANDLTFNDTVSIEVDIYEEWGFWLWKKNNGGYTREHIKKIYRDMEYNNFARNSSCMQSDNHRISHRFQCYLGEDFIEAIYDSDIHPISLVEHENSFTITLRIEGNLLRYLDQRTDVRFLLCEDYYKKYEGHYKKIKNCAEIRNGLLVNETADMPFTEGSECII